MVGYSLSNKATKSTRVGKVGGVGVVRCEGKSVDIIRVKPGHNRNRNGVLRKLGTSIRLGSVESGREGSHDTRSIWNMGYWIWEVKRERPRGSCLLDTASQLPPLDGRKRRAEAPCRESGARETPGSRKDGAQW